jgi:hypothetical protein
MELPNDEIIENEELFKDDEMDVKMQLSPDDKEQLNAEDCMDVDEQKVDENNPVFIINENR